MKKIYLGISILCATLLSCSTDDDNNNSPTNYLPLTPTSAWVYDVGLNASTVGRDSLYIDGETTLNGFVYQKFVTKSIPAGFYTSILNNNNVRTEGGKILVTGAASIGLADFLPLSLDLNDFVVFKENAGNNEELSTISGTIEQNLQGFPLKINYQLKSVFKESLSSFTVPGKETYSNVKAVKLIGNLSISTVYLLPVLNTPITIPILNSQDVIVSTNYYAPGVGMIYSKTDINYQLNDLPQGNIDLPIPQQGSSTIEEFLD